MSNKPTKKIQEQLYNAFKPTDDYEGNPQLLLLIAIYMADTEKIMESVAKYHADPNKPIERSTWAALKNMGFDI